MPKIPKIINCAISEQHLKDKELSDKVDFFACRQTWMFPTNWYYDFWWGWSSIPKVLKIASLQCLYNISRKKDEVDLPAGKHQRFLQIDIILEACVSRHAQVTQNNKCFISLQYLQKEWVMKLISCMYFFFSFFLILIFGTVRGIKGQKIAQNEK